MQNINVKFHYYFLSFLILSSYNCIPITSPDIGVFMVMGKASEAFEVFRRDFVYLDYIMSFLYLLLCFSVNKSSFVLIRVLYIALRQILLLLSVLILLSIIVINDILIIITHFYKLIN